MLSKAEDIEQLSLWKSKAFIVVWVWCLASNLSSSQILKATLWLTAHTVESLLYWLVSSLERSTQVIYHKVYGLSEDPENFLCCNSSVMFHQKVLVWFSHICFGEAVKASSVTAVPRIRKTNANVNKEGARDGLHFKGLGFVWLLMSSKRSLNFTACENSNLYIAIIFMRLFPSCRSFHRPKELEVPLSPHSFTEPQKMGNSLFLLFKKRSWHSNSCILSQGCYRPILLPV